MARNYDMSKRSEQAANTRKDIIAATEQLLTNKSLAEVDLKAIAEEANTTVQTVLRHMNSRYGCLEAVARQVAARVATQRGISDYENFEEAIFDLVEHYELEGKLILNILAQEHGGDHFISEQTKKGRDYHRQWVKRCFADYLKSSEKSVIDELAAVTDIYVWKLLRLDTGRSKRSTCKIIINIVKKILEVS